MKPLILVLSLFVIGTAHSQERVDTLYYDREGHVVRNTFFADYSRVVLSPADSTERMHFKDFYLTGELRREGTLLYVDSLDDRRSIFDGENVSYYRNGRVAEKSFYRNGKRDGEYRRYDDRGKLREQATYLFGDLFGTRKRYNDDGSCRIDEYNAGVTVNNYYTVVDGNGNALKFRNTDDTQIWESPAVSGRSVDYRDGASWEVYFKNGLTIAVKDAVVRDYGKWHRLDLVISNNSLTAIEFVPELLIRGWSANAKGVVTNLNVWSCDDYMKKVKRSQTWASIFMGLSEGLSSATAGYSTSTTTGYNSRGEYSTYTTTTYNSTDAYMANLASQQRMADFGRSLQREQEVRQMGYLKRNTLQPGESIAGFVHADWVNGERVAFIVTIEGAEYTFEWEFDRRNTRVIE